MAKRVAEARQGRTIESTHGLLAALKLPVVWHGRTKDGRRQIHPATRFFQVCWLLSSAVRLRRVLQASSTMHWHAWPAVCVQTTALQPLRNKHF